VYSVAQDPGAPDVLLASVGRLREADRQARHGVQPARWAGSRNRRSRSVKRLEADAAVAVGNNPLPALLDDVRSKRRTTVGMADASSPDAGRALPPR
jgi:hypothetical protein